MPLSPQEEFELLSLEREKALASPQQNTPPQLIENPSLQRRALQSLPRSLAFGPSFQGAQGGSLGDIEIGAYNAGAKITDLTGSPLAGTAVRMIPDIASMAVGGLPGKTAAPALEGAGKWLMQSAVKPNIKDLRSGKAQRAIETMLESPTFGERGLSPTNAGVENILRAGEAKNKDIASFIAPSTATVEKGATGAGLQDVITKIEATNPIPQEARATVEKVWDQFLSNSVIPKNIPVQQAQVLKQGIYKMLKDAYGQPGVDPAKTQALKALGLQLKQRIETAVPGVAPLNAQAKELWNALDIAERRALLEANKDPVRLALLPHNPTAMLGMWANSNAAFKSMLAKMLYKGSEQIPATASRVGIAGYEATQP